MTTMSGSWTAWRVMTAFWVATFVGAAWFLWARTVDGAGAVQTTETRALSVLVLAVAYVIPVAFQAVWAVRIRRANGARASA